MKKLLMLFWTFFKLGIVNFGGGYALLPLLQREFCERKKWLTDDEIADYYAIGQCTPGAIAVNVSTFVGYKLKGVLGGIVATIGFVSPALIIIAVIASVLTNFADVAQVKSAFTAIRVCVFVLVLKAIIGLAKTSLKDLPQLIIAGLVLLLSIFVEAIPLYVYVIVAGFAGIMIGLYREKKKQKNIRIEKPLEKEEAPLEDVASEEKVEIEEVKTEEEVNVIEENNTDTTHDSLNMKSIGKNLLYFFLGFLTGITLGLIGFPLNFIVKNKKFKEGYYTTILLWVLLAILITIFLFNHDNGIFLNVFGQFFRVGICAFGGGLATIPFLKELGQMTGWFSIDELANMIAISESTPGAMGVNMSTYVGYEVIKDFYNNMALGYVGGVVSTLGLVAPSILVIIIVCQILEKFRNAKGVEWAFYGLRAASIGLIGNAAYSILTLSICTPDNAATAFKANYNNNFWTDIWGATSAYVTNFFNYKNLALGLFMGLLIFKFKKHPIFYIALAAVIGIVFQF